MIKGDKVKCIDLEKCEDCVLGKEYTVKDVVEWSDISNHPLIILEEIPYIAYSILLFEKL